MFVCYDKQSYPVNSLIRGSAAFFSEDGDWLTQNKIRFCMRGDKNNGWTVRRTLICSRALALPFVDGYSTTALVKKIRAG